MKTAVGAADVWVFRRDARVTRAKVLKGLLWALVLLALFVKAILIGSTWAILGAAILLPAMLFCGLYIASTCFYQQSGALELDGNELREVTKGKTSHLWNLLGSQELVSFRFQRRANNDCWVVKYPGRQHLILKREWNDFDTLLKLIEERSGKRFEGQILP